jgi:hypothetical protein
MIGEYIPDWCLIAAATWAVCTLSFAIVYSRYQAREAAKRALKGPLTVGEYRKDREGE